MVSISQGGGGDCFDSLSFMCYFFLFQTYSEYVYFCYYVLCAETLYQEKCGLKYALANKLHDKPEMCIETALKVREEINKNLRIK